MVRALDSPAICWTAFEPSPGVVFLHLGKTLYTSFHPGVQLNHTSPAAKRLEE